MKKLFLIILYIQLLACSSNEAPYSKVEYSLLIKNGQIIDGSGEAPYASDILIHHDTIAAIGTFDASQIKVDSVVDATGKIITPGFIDAHAHGDPIETPEFKNFLAMGVTTICLGQDGRSPNENLNSWMDKVEAKGLGVNIIMFVGHGTLRRMAGIDFDESPSEEKLKQQQQLLQQAFDHGVFGMTTGLEYTPGIYADDDELLPLAKIVGQNNGLIMSHVRNEDDDQIENSIRELLRQGQYCNVQVSHMKSVYGKGKDRGKELLTLLGQNPNNTYTVTADVYPYTASYTGIGIVFPKWAKPPNDYMQVVQARREELLAYLKQKIIDRNGPEATLFGTKPYAGKTLAQVAKEENLPYEKVLLGIGPNRASGAYFIMDEDLQEEIIAHSKVMICSDGSPTMRHPRGYGSFAKIIEDFVQQRNRLSLPEAVHKMAGLTAKIIGIAKRGVIKEGNYADLLIFDSQQVKANASFEAPHQLASGFELVLVNGEVAWKGGKALKGAGKVLKKKKNKQ